jgi:membrane protease YdiL (CAAX protease family)
VVHGLGYGVLEEWGWRGLLLPTLLTIMPPLRATLVVFLVWGGWHAPLFFYHFPPEPGLMAGFIVSLLGGTVLATWLYLASGRALPVLMAWHALYDVVSVLGAEAAPLAVGIASAMLVPLGLWLARRLAAWPVPVGQAPGTKSRTVGK